MCWFKCQYVCHCHIFHSYPSNRYIWECLHCPYNHQSECVKTFWAFKFWTSFMSSSDAPKFMSGNEEEESENGFYLPFRMSTIISLLVFLESCKTGPITIAGLMVAMFKPFSFTKSHAAFSASVLDILYHSCQPIGKPILVSSLKSHFHSNHPFWYVMHKRLLEDCNCTLAMNLSVL